MLCCNCFTVCRHSSPHAQCVSRNQSKVGSIESTWSDLDAGLVSVLTLKGSVTQYGLCKQHGLHSMLSHRSVAQPMFSIVVLVQCCLFKPYPQMQSFRSPHGCRQTISWCCPTYETTSLTLALQSPWLVLSLAVVTLPPFPAP